LSKSIEMALKARALFVFVTSSCWPHILSLVSNF
jgi:hypothetical protein